MNVYISILVAIPNFENIVEKVNEEWKFGIVYK